MVDPEKPAEPDAPAEVIDPASMYWKSFDPDIGNVPEGILGKVLRIDPDNGDWTWLASCIPGWQSDEAETHPTVEECLMIRGDILLPERGGMKAGSYFWRPAMVKHGPLISRGGGCSSSARRAGSSRSTTGTCPAGRRWLLTTWSRSPTTWPPSTSGRVL